MRLVIKSVFVRRSVTVIGVVIFAGVVAWIAKTCAAYELALTPTVKRLELAAKLDPNNAEYHLRLAGRYQYNVWDIQPEKALEQLQEAVRLNPYNPEGWTELARAMEFQGSMSKAEECLRKADALAPNLPAYQWPIANFYLLQGNTDEAFRHFRPVLAGTSEYDQIVFRTAWRATDDGHKILDQLIPQNVSTEFRYLYYLLSHQLFTEAQPVWKRILTGAESFTPQQTAGYIDALIQARRPDGAYAVWTDLQRKGLVRHTETGGPGNLLNNGDFEDELLNLGFGWRLATVEGVYAGLDPTTYHSPGRSLLVQFSGKQNLEYQNVYQYVKVEPNRAYRLEAFMKTDGITTDSGPRLEVRDAYDRAALEKSTDGLTDTSNGWTDLTLDFTTGPKTSLLVVALERIPSQKLDNLIAGKVWIDDVRLTTVQNERQPSRGPTTR